MHTKTTNQRILWSDKKRGWKERTLKWGRVVCQSTTRLNRKQIEENANHVCVLCYQKSLEISGILLYLVPTNCKKKNTVLHSFLHYLYPHICSFFFFKIYVLKYYGEQIHLSISLRFAFKKIRNLCICSYKATMSRGPTNDHYEKKSMLCKICGDRNFCTLDGKNLQI